MSIFQTGSVVFALLMLYVISIHQKKKLLSNFEASGWYSLWSFFIVLALFPELLLGISGVLKFARVFDMLVVVAFMILTMLLFYTYFRLKALNQKLEQAVREKALAHASEKK